LPEKPNSSSIKNDYRIASEANENIDKNKIAIAADIIPDTTVTGIGEVTATIEVLVKNT